ncbi:MAG: hypothetical protein J7M18_01930, partial [Candidatus Eremiobacteraeota bacterium]|nr:hypothetical protein [Candidatus Eremiobacteraeota bacterium]
MSQDKNKDIYSGKIKQKAILFSSGKDKAETGKKRKPDKKKKSGTAKPKYIAFRTEKIEKKSPEKKTENHVKLYNDGIESAPFYQVLGENAVILFMVLLGVVGLLPIRIFGLPIVSLLYLAFTVIMLIFVLRKHLCTHCWYHGKRCHCGWGKISAGIYPEKSGEYTLAPVLAYITWAVLVIVPLIVMLGVVLFSSTQRGWALVFLILFSLLAAA